MDLEGSRKATFEDKMRLNLPMMVCVKESNKRVNEA